MILFVFISFILGLILIISIYNFYTAPVIKPAGKKLSVFPLISVLIPARNEENNILKCLKSISSQSYANMEIIVLDDHSSDKTSQFVENYSKEKKNVSLIAGKELPDGWLGKNWACHQLSLQAKGEYLLFIDADVELNQNTLEAALQELLNSRTEMISVFSTQIIKSAGEWIIVPLMNWLLLSFLPLKLVNSSRNKAFVAANGQFILWKNETYNSIDGHKSVRNKIVEDMAFARICKSNNIPIKTFLGGKMIFCRMYTGLIDALKGFSKNFFPGFDLSPVIFIPLISSMLILFFLPYVMIFFNIVYVIPLGTIILIRSFVSITSRQSVIINALLHPFQMLFMCIIGVRSLINFKSGNLEWKNRRY